MFDLAQDPGGRQHPLTWYLEAGSLTLQLSQIQESLSGKGGYRKTQPRSVKLNLDSPHLTFSTVRL